jgi:hypothetical protein
VLILIRRAILDGYQRPPAVDSISEMFTRKNFAAAFYNAYYYTNWNWN